MGDDLQGRPEPDLGRSGVRLVLSLFLALGLLAAGSVAPARVREGSASDRPPSMKLSREQYRSLVAFYDVARCAFARDERMWFQILTTGLKPSQSELDSVKPCLEETRVIGMTANITQWGGVLAEHFYSRYYAKPVSINADPYEQLRLRLDQNDERVMRYGDCVVRRSPAQLDLLVRTRANTPKERQILQELIDRNGDCLSPGPDVVRKRAELRGVLALSLFLRSLPRDKSGNFIHPSGLANA